jgi:cytoskeleton protein RodZ
MSLALWLRTGRTERKLSLADIARITKIQLRILERLEGGNLDGLPAEVFVRGFIRSFAKCSTRPRR